MWYDIDPHLLLRSDFLEDRGCVHCCSPGELYTFRGEFVAICSTCTAEALAVRADRLPFDLIPLEAAAVEATAERRESEARPYTLRLDTFYRCHGCDRLIEQKDARYPQHYSEQGRGMPPHCQRCYDAIQSGTLLLKTDDISPPPAPRAMRALKIDAPAHRIPDGATRVLKGTCEGCGAPGDAFVFGHRLLLACPYCSPHVIEARAGTSQNFAILQVLREMRKEVGLRSRPDWRAPPAENPFVQCMCGSSSVRLHTSAYDFIRIRLRGRAHHCMVCP